MGRHPSASSAPAWISSTAGPEPRTSVYKVVPLTGTRTIRGGSASGSASGFVLRSRVSDVSHSLQLAFLRSVSCTYG